MNKPHSRGNKPSQNRKNNIDSIPSTKQEPPSIKKKGIKDLISSTWGLLITGSTLISMGFGAGCYIMSSLCDIRHNDEITRLNEKIIDIKMEHEKELHELRQELYKAQNELITIKKKNEN